MIRFVPSVVFACLFALASNVYVVSAQEKPVAPVSVKAETETKYLAFQIFTYFSPDPKVAALLSNGLKERLTPGTPALRDYVLDIKQRIGAVGDRQTRLAVILGPLCFEQTDAEIAEYIERAFDLALETDVAVGFHIDDSIFWLRRKDLWSDPKNVEALDWDGTPCTGRQLNWGRNPTAAPPQMCFNSMAVQQEVHRRSALIGKAVAAGVNRLQQAKKPELFAGAIAGWETMIGQDFETGKYLGYRALLNRGFSREHPPRDMDAEREKVVEEFIDLWTKGLADAGVSPQMIYSHTAFLSRRAFNLGADKSITYMQRGKENGYSQHNHFAPPPVAFGNNHRSGFSTYPQPGLFDDIYNELSKHTQTGWASCEGTNMQPATGPGQTGMNMETYLAKVFNHGGTLVNIFAWGIGGEAMKKMDFRVVTEGEDALAAYRKFLKGEPLVEAKTAGLSLMERLPPKMHKIQDEFPAWMQKIGSTDKPTAEKASALMQKLQEQMNVRNFDEVEKTADSILQLMGASTPTAAPENPKEVASPLMERLPLKVHEIQKDLPAWIEKGGDKEKATSLMQKLGQDLDAKKFEDAEKQADSILKMIGSTPDVKGAESSPAPADAGRRVPEEARRQMRHNIDSSFVVFRDTVQEELKLTGEQKTRLEEVLPDVAQFLGRIQSLKPDERKKELKAYRPKAREKLAAVVNETLTEVQRIRLRQIVLQREGLRNGEIWKDLQITDEQQQQFIPLMRQAQRETQALMEELQKTGKLKEMQPKVIKVRDDLEGKLNALLTDAQKNQWKQMQGKPMALSDLFDL